jgi:1-acyl-sn-glycerol-3-phosphate acyltransferase
MSGPIDALRTLWAGSVVIGLTGTLAPVVTLLSFKHEEAPDELLRFWARSLLSAAGVQVAVEGEENLPTDRHFILAINHQSHFDVPVILASLKHHLRFVAKTELYRIPLFGRAVRATGNIEVDRTGSDKDRRALSSAVTAVRERVSIIFFPEGTRSEDGNLKPFKRGAAVLAIDAQVPLIPAAIAGTWGILPKKTLSIRHGQRTALVVGAPIETTGLTLDDRESLTRQTEGAVTQLFARANQLVKAG